MITFGTYLNAIKALIPLFAAPACGILACAYAPDNPATNKRKLRQAVIIYLKIAVLAWLPAFCYGYAPRLFVLPGTYCFLICALLSYRAIRGRQPLLMVAAQPREHKPGTAATPPGRHHPGNITRRKLEAYFHNNKPYLQGDLRITDLAGVFDINRAAMSGFMNKTFGVNFNRYVNRWRLKEMKKLATLPPNEGMAVEGYVGRAGFASIRQYYRARKAESGPEGGGKAKKRIRSAHARHASPRWLPPMRALTLIAVSALLPGLLLYSGVFASPCFVWLGAFPAFAVCLVICYNRLPDNCLTLSPSTEKDDAPSEGTHIDRKKFERYLRKEKPYLNPKLHIAEVAAGLNTNRSYVSAFINREYGMNFSRYINHRRLEEMDRLHSSPECKHLDNTDMALMAGFGSYRNYLRVKNGDDKSGRMGRPE